MLSCAKRMRYHATLIIAKAIIHAGKMSIKYAHLLTGVVWDYNVNDAWPFVCSLYGIGKKNVRGIDDARNGHFKGKRDLDVLPSTQSALEIHITRANYPAKNGFKQTMYKYNGSRK